MVRRKAAGVAAKRAKKLAARAQKIVGESPNGTDGAEVTIKEEVIEVSPIKEEAVIEPIIEVTEDGLSGPLPSAQTKPVIDSCFPQDTNDTKLRVVSLSNLRNHQPRPGNHRVDSVVKNNVSRKTKLGTMQAVYKALKRVDEKQEEVDDGNCSEDEDGTVTSSDRNHMHFMLGGDSYDEPAPKIGKYDESAWSDEPVHGHFMGNAKNPDWFSVKRYPAFLGDVSICTSEVSFFSLFFDDSLIDAIVTHTNEEIQRESTDDVQSAIGVTNPIEIRAVLGLLLVHGLMRKTPLSLSDMFSDAFGPPLFKATITKPKLEFILRMMRFDDKTTRDDRKRSDKFAAFRDFWNAFCDNCARWYAPSEYLTVGEGVLGFQGKCPFKIDKNSTTGMMLISLCDARTFYFCGGIPYLGKDFVANNNLRLPTQYVVELTEMVQEPDRNITVEDWFTSVELAEELVKRKFTMVGPVNTEADIPSKLLTSPLSEPKFAYQPGKMMVAFNLNEKTSVFLSTLHKTGVLNAQTGRPDVYELYEMTRRGLDVIDRNCESFSSRKPSNRWPMRFFFRTLDLAVHNSHILYQLATNTTCRRADFIKRLALSLAEPLMQQRMNNTKLPKILRQNVCQVLGVEPRKVVMDLTIEKNASIMPQSATSGRRRCWFCDSKKDRKTSKCCAYCNLPICTMHTVSVIQCQLCADDPNKIGSALET